MAQQTAAETAPLENDAELNAILSATLAKDDGREASRWDTPVCFACDEHEPVETAKRRENNTTVQRHTCQDCGTHGATVVRARFGSNPATVHTGGDVQTIDLAEADR